MANKAETDRQKPWHGRYLGYLCHLAGIGTTPGKPNLGALAELRNSARGDAFEIRALRHIVPYLEEDDKYHRAHVRVAMLVGQLFAAYRPDSPTPATDSEDEAQYRPKSLGWLLGEAEARNKKSGDFSTGTDNTGEGKRNPTALERHLYTLVAADFDRLGSRLRGALARLKQAGVALEIGDYRRSLDDLDKWKLPEKNIQYRWISDFYRNKPRELQTGEPL